MEAPGVSNVPHEMARIDFIRKVELVIRHTKNVNVVVIYILSLILIIPSKKNLFLNPFLYLIFL